MNIRRSVLTLVVLVACLVETTQAGTLGNVLDGLRFAGFAVDKDHNDLSNTSVAALGNTFQGNVIDFGDINVSLTGPVAATIQRGGRLIPTLDIALSTGPLGVNQNRVTSVGPAQPLAYSFSFDSGANTTTVSGNLLADARFSINRLGGYDLRLQFSDRQTTTVDGQFDQNTPFDKNVDLGPIDIQGNIFADVLAVVTDPFFQATETQNIFEMFSGRSILSKQMAATADALRAKIDAGGTLTSAESARIAGLSLIQSILGDEIPNFTSSLSGVGSVGGTDGTSVAAVAVPEPSAIVLLIAGAACIWRRRW